ncbi:hypothetical protein PspLS_03941 [Pyricularia sp. CBS 133598]|nr:hypothetical protein PspLS_03941 [Pyricularia sp. CBS 133598]
MTSLLQYYLVRPASKIKTSSGYVKVPGSKVPMIPIDILPEWLEIVGLPRSLRDSQAVGLKSLGHIEQPQETLEVRLCRVDPSVHDRVIPHAPVSHLPSGNIVTTSMSTVESFGKEPAGTMPGNYVKGAALEEQGKQRRRERPNGERLANTAEPGRPNVDAPRKLDAETPAAQNRQTAEASMSLRAAPTQKQQRNHTTAEEVPACSERAPVAAPNGLPSSVHARRDLSVEVAAKTGSVSAAPSWQDQRSSGRALQLSDNEDMRKTMHGARKKTKVPGARRFCHHWCHYGVCKWGDECHYHHAMPATREGLREVGLKDYPRWWAELSGPSMGTRQRGRTGQNATRRKAASGQEARPHEPELQREPVSRSRRAVMEDTLPWAANPSEELTRLRVSGSSGIAHRTMQLLAASSLVEGKDVIQKNGCRESATITQKLVDLD